jgi:hypothetical protein
LDVSYCIQAFASLEQPKVKEFPSKLRQVYLTAGVTGTLPLKASNKFQELKQVKKNTRSSEC